MTGLMRVDDCDRCNGSGWLPSGNRCWKCHQTGWMTVGGLVTINREAAAEAVRRRIGIGSTPLVMAAAYADVAIDAAITEARP